MTSESIETESGNLRISQSITGSKEWSGSQNFYVTMNDPPLLCIMPYKLSDVDSYADMMARHVLIFLLWQMGTCCDQSDYNFIKVSNNQTQRHKEQRYEIMQIAILPSRDLLVIAKSRLPLYPIRDSLFSTKFFLEEILGQSCQTRYHLNVQNLLYKSRPRKIISDCLIKVSY